MRKLISVICLIIVAASLMACSDTPTKHSNSSGQERINAKEAQEELSRDVNRSAK